MLEWVLIPEAWVALATLLALEIFLGIDNIIYITLLVGRLREMQRDKARTLGIAFAMAFSVVVELLNIRIHRGRIGSSVTLHKRIEI